MLDAAQGELRIELDCHKKGLNNRKNKVLFSFLELKMMSVDFGKARRVQRVI